MKAEEIRALVNTETPGYDPARELSMYTCGLLLLGEIAAQIADANELTREEIARRGTADKNVTLERKRKDLFGALAQSNRLLIDLQAAAKAAGANPHHLLKPIIETNTKLLTGES